MNININDPKITQYALGEMPENEKQAFEKEINGNPEILQEIEEIKQFSNDLENGFSADPALSLSDTRKNMIKGNAAGKKVLSSNKRVMIKFILSAAAMIVIAMVIFTTEIRSIISGASSSFGSDSSENDLSMIKRVSDLSMSRESARRISAKNQVKMVALQRMMDGESKKEKKRSKLPIPSNKPQSRFDTLVAMERFRLTKKSKPSHGNILFVDGHVRGYSGTAWKAIESPALDVTGFNTENYSRIVENHFKKVLDHPLSTFSIDVDTASYANMRRFINQGSLPPVDAVRIEELINYFSYEYPSPEDKPFSVNFEMASCSWNQKHRLVKIGLKGKEIAKDKRPPSNLVFLLDVSGSMKSRNKLPLLKKSMKLLLEQLGENDRVAIVVYAGASGMVLPSTTADKKERILTALDRLSAGGSTNGGAGIQLAYKTAVANFIEGGVNRVILATDGDFNVGITGEGALERLIEKSAKSGVFLSILGFGMGNYKDSNLEKLSGKGNGNYAYIDTLNEAKKVLVNEMGSTLITIAKDVKIQVEFNPTLVEGYRLIGYENRMLKKEDFNDDKKDAGEIGAGHTVTAFYEIVPKGESIATPKVDPLKYRKSEKVKVSETEFSDEVMTVKLRYKEPDGSKSKLLTFPLKNTFKEFGATSDDFKFATAVVELGMLLRDSQYKGDTTFESALDLAKKGLRNDKFGYKKEFISLLKKAEKLKAMEK